MNSTRESTLTFWSLNILIAICRGDRSANVLPKVRDHRLNGLLGVQVSDYLSPGSQSLADLSV